MVEAVEMVELVVVEVMVVVEWDWMVWLGVIFKLHLRKRARSAYELDSFEKIGTPSLRSRELSRSRSRLVFFYCVIG